MALSTPSLAFVKEKDKTSVMTRIKKFLNIVCNQQIFTATGA